MIILTSGSGGEKKQQKETKKQLCACRPRCIACMPAEKMLFFPFLEKKEIKY